MLKTGGAFGFKNEKTVLERGWIFILGVFAKYFPVGRFRCLEVMFVQRRSVNGCIHELKNKKHEATLADWSLCKDTKIEVGPNTRHHLYLKWNYMYISV